MRAIFEQGSLSAYSQVRLDDSRSPILEYSQYGVRKTTVFISHKHDDLDTCHGDSSLYVVIPVTFVLTP